VAATDAGDYHLNIANDCGAQTNTSIARVVIHEKPKIVVYDTARKNHCPGESVEFAVEATSTLPMQYQWFKNGAPIPSQVQSILRLENLKPEDTGDYHVTVKNQCDTTMTERTHLQVGVTILTQPSDSTAPVCGTAGFSVLADGVGPLRYQWRLDRAPLTNDVYFAGTASAALSIQPSLYAHEGKYDVIITDDCGAQHSVTSRVATLTVTPGPQWFFRTTNGPPPRYDHAMVYDSHRGVTVMFGGVEVPEYQKFESLGDLWEWDGARWLQRMAHSTTNEGWIKTPTAAWRPSMQGRPVERHGHMMAYDSARGRVLLFGGETGAPDGSQIYLNDLWEWDGTTWHFRATNGPSPRADAGMAYDSGRKRTVLYGGQFSAGVMEARGAVWEWDGEQWSTNDTIFTSSYSQSVGGMVYDRFRQETVYGPMLENTTSGRFWDWDGQGWTLRTGPEFDLEHFQMSRTENGALAYDSYRRRTVWFGGVSGVVANRTGFFDGEDWTLLTTSPVLPAPRTEPAMAYDSRRRALVMFGGDLKGFSPNPFVIQMTNDTWELIALDTPLINEQPASQYRRAGETARFSVSAVGPQGQGLTYRWVHDGVPLTSSGRITDATTSTLTISNVEAADAGMYRANLKNDCGETWSLPAVLTLRPDLQIFPTENTTTLIWTDSGVVLEVAETLFGPWTRVAGATSPFRPAVLGPSKFFRLQVASPP
jgi:hypothetical protein